MSALTLLSVIAPAVPSVPQGSSGEAASDFQDLLAALAGEDAAAPDAKAPAEPSKSDEAQVRTEVDAPAGAGFLAPPTPLVLLPAKEAVTDAGAEDVSDGTGEAGASATAPADDMDGTQATTPLLADKASPSKAVEPEVLPREQTTTPLPTDKSSSSKPPRPEVQPPLPDVRPAAETSETELTLAETAAAREALEARARTGAAPAPSSPTPAAPAQPLRPLAERTSRLAGPLEARTDDGARATDPARPAGTPATPAPAVAANPAAGPADFAAVARDVANGGETERPPSEPLPPPESATAQTQTAAARETGGPQLSRATIEATAQIAAQILRRLEGRSTRFEMALTPDELGRVDVKLDIDSEGRLNARLAFDNPAAATDLRGRADELRRQLEDAGFHLAEDAFEFADRDSGSNAFDRGQDARNGSSRAFAAASRLNTEIDVAQPPLWLALSLSPSSVDMKV